MAGNNVSGRLGLFRGDMASAEPTVIAPNGGQQAVAALLPAERVQTVAGEPAGFPAQIVQGGIPLIHVGNGLYQPTPALGSRNLRFRRMLPWFSGASDQAIVTPPPFSADQSGQLLIPFK